MAFPYLGLSFPNMGTKMRSRKWVRLTIVPPTELKCPQLSLEDVVKKSLFMQYFTCNMDMTNNLIPSKTVQRKRGGAKQKACRVQ